MDIYICKICGRCFRSLEPPKYCYADGIENYEKISNEEAERIGVFFESHAVHEFPGDINYDVMTKEKIGAVGDTTLTGYQRELMKGLKI